MRGPRGGDWLEDKIRVLRDAGVHVIVSLLDLVIHCRQGIGRSTVMAVAVLALRGMRAETAFDVIARARGCSVPDTDQQRDWVINLVNDISGHL